MLVRNLFRIGFGLLAAAVIFLALVPGPIGQLLASDTERHYLAFLVLPIVAYVGWPTIGALRLWLAFAVFGAVIELCQHLMAVGREAQWHDWFTDLVAAAMASVAALCVHRFLARKSKADAEVE